MTCTLTRFPKPWGFNTDSGASHWICCYSKGARAASSRASPGAPLRRCAKMCQTYEYMYTAINSEGCWCDDTFHEKSGDGITVPDENCLMDGLKGGGNTSSECVYGPCGGDAFHTAIYRLPNTGRAQYSSPKGNSFVSYDVDLSVYFDATWSFRGLGYGIDGALEVKSQTGETVASITFAEASAVQAVAVAQRATAARTGARAGRSVTKVEKGAQAGANLRGDVHGKSSSRSSATASTWRGRRAALGANASPTPLMVSAALSKVGVWFGRRS